jgi:hypothetical protein
MAKFFLIAAILASLLPVFFLTRRAGLLLCSASESRGRFGIRNFSSGVLPGSRNRTRSSGVIVGLIGLEQSQRPEICARVCGIWRTKVRPTLLIDGAN